MSRITFPAALKDGTEVTVTGGWDRPLQEYFLFIQIPEHGMGAIADVAAKNSAALMSVLDRMDITAPEGFWQMLENREANVEHSWTGEVWLSMYV